MENITPVAGNQKILISTTGRVDVINVDHLVSIQAQSNYSRLIFSDGTSILVAKVLRKFEEQLNGQLFIRAHKTHLVNMHFIRSYEGKMHKMLVLDNGDNITVARSKHRFVLQQLMNLRAV